MFTDSITFSNKIFSLCFGTQSHKIKMTIKKTSQAVYLCEVDDFKNVSYVFKLK